MDLNALKVFVKVAELQSFTKAAQVLRLTQSGVSRAVTRLEHDLHVTLFNRNTHSVSLTTDGLFLYESSRNLINEMDDVGQLLTGRALLPEGELRITTPSTYGRLIIIPIFKDVLEKYPALSIDAVMTDRLVGLVEEGFDAAIRIGHVQDSRLIARTIKHLRYITVASPEYLNKYGIPRDPAELIDYNCLSVKAQKTGLNTKWMFNIKGENKFIDIKGNFSVDTADVLLEAALNGMGIVQIMDFSANDHIQKGTLIELFKEYSVGSVPLSLIYAKSRHRSPKISALLTALGVGA